MWVWVHVGAYIHTWGWRQNNSQLPFYLKQGRGKTSQTNPELTDAADFTSLLPLGVPYFRVSPCEVGITGQLTPSCYLRGFWEFQLLFSSLEGLNHWAFPQPGFYFYSILNFSWKNTAEGHWFSSSGSTQLKQFTPRFLRRTFGIFFSRVLKFVLIL